MLDNRPLRNFVPNVRLRSAEETGSRRFALLEYRYERDIAYNTDTWMICVDNNVDTMTKTTLNITPWYRLVNPCGLKILPLG